jgi:hypothetical protein
MLGGGASTTGGGELAMARRRHIERGGTEQWLGALSSPTLAIHPLKNTSCIFRSVTSAVTGKKMKDILFTRLDVIYIILFINQNHFFS